MTEPDLRPAPPRALFATRGWRFAMMILLTLLMGVPLLMISALVDDRAQYQRQAVGEVSGQWGGPIRLAGPIIVIPVEKEAFRSVADADGIERRERDA